MDLSIIFVNWNSLDYLRECIPSIYEYTRGISFEIVVVDNASPNDNVEQLKKLFPEVKFIKSSTNLGFAGANNLAFSYSSGKYILFLNPDTKLVSPAINIMLQELQSLPDAGVVGSKLLNADLSVQTSCIMKFPTILDRIIQAEFLRLRWPGFWGIGPLFSERPDPAAVEAVSGACMLIRRNVFERVGMFSEDYFMYSEDVDLCYKTTRAGLKNYFIGQATIIHYAGTSSASEWQTVMKQRAELRFCEKNYGRLYGWLFRIISVLNAAARLVIVVLLSSLQKLLGRRNTWEAASAKWSAILRTLLTQYPTATNLLPDGSALSTCSGQRD